MMQFRKQLLLPYPREYLFDLVTDISSYPEFVPWCHLVSVEEPVDGLVNATLFVRYRRLQFSFTTRNCNTRPDSVDMQLEKGPFSLLSGRWDFIGLGTEGSKTSLTLDYQLPTWGLGPLIAPVFGEIATVMVDAFTVRAHALYGASLSK